MKKLAAILLIALASCTRTETMDPHEVQVFALQFGDAAHVVQTVGREERGKPGMIELAADSRTNSIIVKADAVGLARVERRIRELDVR